MTRDPADDVSMSAYDLLPQEDRDAIAWVREHGGLEKIIQQRRESVPRAAYERKKAGFLGHIAECETALRRRNERIAELEHERGELRESIRELGQQLSDLANEVRNQCRAFDVDVSECDTAEDMLHDMNEALSKRLMPEGMEWLLEVWPKWSNGEYCKFGDWWTADKYGETEPKPFRKLSIYTPEQLDEWRQGDGESYGYEWDFMRPSDPKYRPDKLEPPAPKVLDADGVEIRVGDTVYHVKDGSEMTVYGIEGEWLVVSVGSRARHDTVTHRAPVLAADGRPLREGETVWLITSGREMRIDKIEHRPEGFWALELFADGSKRHSAPVSILAHERPVADTWERLEEDAEKDPCGYFGFDGEETCGKCPASGKNCEQTMARDLVRRARALAGRDAS